MKNLIVRTLSGIGFLAIMIGALLWCRFSFAALMLWITGMMMFEFFRMTMGTSYRFSQVLAILAAVILFVLTFLFKSYDLVALLEPMIAPEHLLSYVAQLRIRERHVLIVDLSTISGLRKPVEPRHALAELVRKENNEKQSDQENQDYNQDEHRVRTQGLLHIIFERQGHADNIAAI